MVENKFFKMYNIGENKIETELIMKNDKVSQTLETIRRGEYPSVIPFLKNPLIVMKVYSYYGNGEFMERKTAEITKKDNQYNSLNKRLLEAGL